MKYLNLSKQIVSMAILALVFTACDKVTVQKSIGDSGQTLVKVLYGGTPAAPSVTTFSIDFVNIPKTLALVDVRRDIPNATELNKTMKVTVKNDDAAVATASAAYVILPAAWYTIDASSPKDAAGNFNLVMAPGEFAKEIKITITNPTLLDPSTTYALGFTLTAADAGGVISQQTTMVCAIGAKNAYDGVYSYVSGFVQRYSGPGPTAPICCDGLTGPLGPANPDVFMITVGASTVAIPPASDLGRITWSNPASGVAGIDGLRVLVNPATNLVTMSSLGNATLANLGANSYDPATKTFSLNFRWNPTANTRDYQVVLKYKQSR